MDQSDCSEQLIEHVAQLLFLFFDSSPFYSLSSWEPSGAQEIGGLAPIVWHPTRMVSLHWFRVRFNCFGDRPIGSHPPLPSVCTLLWLGVQVSHPFCSLGPRSGRHGVFSSAKPSGPLGPQQWCSQGVSMKERLGYACSVHGPDHSCHSRSIRESCVLKH